MVVHSWPLEALLFEGDIIAGPIPTCFAEDVGVAKEAITGDPSKSHWDVQKMTRAFFKPESITVKEAQAVAKKAREGAAIYSFKRPRWVADRDGEQPPPKRNRPDMGTETGEITFKEIKYSY